jgi:YesN/AraC family two-component response regulator
MIRAIVIDDERASYGVIEYLIDNMNMPIKMTGYFNSGESGWHAIKTLNPDLVFLDIKMPGLNGIDLMKMIRDEYEGKISIIVITAYDYFEYAQSALRFGAKDILLKPIDRKLFTESIEAVIGFKLTDNSLFNQIVEYIHQRYGEEIVLKDCAAMFHTSPQHISRLFKKYMDMSFINYVNQYRINQAKILFSETNLSIKEVADRVGYNNLNYFYKNFKGKLGMTPKEYLSNKRD